jgi:hypothetical protein
MKESLERKIIIIIIIIKNRRFGVKKSRTIRRNFFDIIFTNRKNDSSVWKRK